MYIHMYTHIHTYPPRTKGLDLSGGGRVCVACLYVFVFMCLSISCLYAACWLRTNRVNTNGAAAKVMSFDGLGKKVRPGTFGNIKVG